MASTGDPLNIDVVTSTGIRIRFNNWAEQILIEAPEGHTLLPSIVGRGDLPKGNSISIQMR